MRSFLKCFAVVIVCMVFSGCSTILGGFYEQTHFSYPNSNIKPLGHVKAALSKTSVFIPPVVTEEDIRSLLNKALAQQSEADLIINYRTNTINTVYIPTLPIFWKTDVILEGTAVSMEVGAQELQEAVEKSKY